MRITPLDVRKQEFKRGMRGYDADEVRAFMLTLADEYEAVLVDNRQLRERMLEMDEKLAEYRNLERTLRDTLMTAERVAQEARETAHKQGDLLVEEARQRVDQVLAEGRTQLEELRREALALHREKEAFLGRFQSMAEAQIQFVAAHRSDFKGLDGRLLEKADLAAWSQAKPVGHEMPPAGELSEQVQESSPPRAWAPAGPRPDVRDRWRDYAIERTPAAATAEVSRLAEAVNDAATDAPDEGAFPAMEPAAPGTPEGDAAPVGPAGTPAAPGAAMTAPGVVDPASARWPWPRPQERPDVPGAVRGEDTAAAAAPETTRP